MKIRTLTVAILTAVGTLVVPVTQATALPRPGELFGALQYPPVGGGCPNLKSQISMRTKTKFDETLTKSVLQRNIQNLQPYELWFLASTFETDLDYLKALTPDDAKQKILDKAAECAIVHDTCVATTNALEKLPYIRLNNLTRESLTNELENLKSVDLWEIAKLNSDAASRSDVTSKVMTEQIVATADSCNLLKTPAPAPIPAPAPSQPMNPADSDNPTHQTDQKLIPDPSQGQKPSTDKSDTDGSSDNSPLTIILGIVAALAVIAGIGSAAFAAGAGHLSPIPPRV